MTSGSGSVSTDPELLGVLDLGTNTFNLLIGELTETEGRPDIRPLFADRTPVKLRKEMVDGDRLSEAAQQRGIQAIEGHLQTLQEWDCHERIAIGTSGLRSARNAADFLSRVRDRTGLNPEIIDGEREAELITEGVRSALPLGKEPILILDIGGGSSEFIIADESRTYWKRSFEIGAARLLQEIDPSDPITEAEYKKTRERTLEMLTPLRNALQKNPTRTLVGCSGSFESISDMAFHHFPNAADPTDQRAVEVRLSHYQELQRGLLVSNLQERKKMKGLAEMRAEMIVLGSILIETVMEIAGSERLFTSYYALREGVLMEAAKKRST